MISHSFAYIDPPYVANGHKLYRYSFSKRQHEKLAAAVSSLQVPWMLSYDNHKIVRDLYGSDFTSTVSTFHAIRGSKFVDELLILSKDFELCQIKPPVTRQFDEFDFAAYPN